MNLLPIIYTSLIIFTSFVVFVVTISYITYKIKEKNRVNLQTAPLNFSANYIEKPRLNNTLVQKQQERYSVPRQEYKMEIPEPEIHEEPTYYTNEVPVNRYENTSYIRSTRPTVEMPRLTNFGYRPNFDTFTRHRTTNVNNQSRFDVLNDKSFSYNGGTTLQEQEFSFLNYYADEEEMNSSQSYSKVS